MSSTPVTLRNAIDTWAGIVVPSQNHADEKRLGLDSGEAYTFLHFNRPFPLGATIVSATLRVYTKGAWNVTPTLTVKRADASWKSSRLNWNNKPGVIGSAYAASHASNADGDEWAIDITGLMSTVAAGGAYYGLRIETTNTTLRYLYSADAVNFRPTLDIVWTEAPQAPSTLSPSGNRHVSIAKPILRFDFTDDIGSTQLAAVNVQIDAANNFVSGIDFDSGTVAATEPELDLSATAYAGITAGTSTWWRVRVQDSAGLWSAWSDPSQFSRTNKGTLAITNPAVSPNNFVTEYTPPLAHSISGVTQTAFQYQLALASDPTAILWDSGRVKGTAVTLTPPEGVLVDGSTYRMTVRLWDTVDRESTPNDPAYTTTFRDFTVNKDATVSPVTGLSATADGVRPWMTLNFSRATAPDYFVVERDGKVIEDRIIPSEIFVSGTAYAYKDKDSRRARSHTWIVYAVVGAKLSLSNPTVVATTSGSGIWLSDNERDIQVLFVNTESSTWSMGESADSWTPLGANNGIRITQGIRGIEGHIDGQMVELGGKTADEWADNLENIRARPGRTLTLQVGKEAYRVVAYNIVVAPIGFAPVVTRAASFDFMQVGKQNYEPRL